MAKPAGGLSMALPGAPAFIAPGGRSSGAPRGAPAGHPPCLPPMPARMAPCKTSPGGSPAVPVAPRQ